MATEREEARGFPAGVVFVVNPTGKESDVLQLVSVLGGDCETNAVKGGVER